MAKNSQATGSERAKILKIKIYITIKYLNT